MAVCSICQRGTSFGLWKPKSQKRTIRKIKINLHKTKNISLGEKESSYKCSRCLRNQRRLTTIS